MMTSHSFIVEEKEELSSLAKDIRSEENISTEGKYIDKDFIDYIKNDIHPDWILVKTLEKGVAFHFSDMPSYVKNEIVSSFNENRIKSIICTTTITEGVNTSAKRVIILDNYKGREANKLTPFEVKNIKGRAGRSMHHFIGEVDVITTDLKEEEELEEIQFECFDKEDIEDEMIIQLEKEHLSKKSEKKRKRNSKKN